MRRISAWIAALSLAAVLAACSAQVEAPPDQQATEAAPVDDAPPPAAAPDQPAAQEEQQAEAQPAPPPMPPPAPVQIPDEQASIAPAPSAPGSVQDRTRGINPPRAEMRAPASTTAPVPRMQERTLTPVVVELQHDQARTPRQGGSAVVLLGDPAVALLARRNLALCEALYTTFDQATREQVEVGVRRDAEGQVQLLRPIYWLARTLTAGAPGAEGCARRLQAYDYPRAAVIKSKFRLSGTGPYLIVERNDQSATERVVAVIDLSRTRDADVVNMVRYFRDGFVQRGDIWNPGIYAPDRTRGDLTAFFGAPVQFGLLPRLVRVTHHVGCPLANLLDICDSAPG
ncbi:MAG: hypothetical protein GC189_06860 [Alphaproteobacteria bacterium]|nr:hypothetical protein [Alphaproteobacteria bacterium]